MVLRSIVRSSTSVGSGIRITARIGIKRDVDFKKSGRMFVGYDVTSSAELDSSRIRSKCTALCVYYYLCDETLGCVGSFKL